MTEHQVFLRPTPTMTGRLAKSSSLLPQTLYSSATPTGSQRYKQRRRERPVFAYLFARRSPIEGGRTGATHTAEVPFIFGTAGAARACVGDGPDIEPMTRMMMATWATFARSGATPIIRRCLSGGYSASARPTDNDPRYRKSPGNRPGRSVPSLARGFCPTSDMITLCRPFSRTSSHHDARSSHQLASRT